VVPPGVPQTQCRYCGHIIHVEHRKPPPNVAQFAPHTVYIDPNAAKAARSVGLIIAICALLPILIPIAIGVVPWMMRKMKSYPVACATNEEIELSGDFTSAGPIITSAGHNCKVHIKNAKLKGSTLVKTDIFNMEITLDNVTLETSDTAIHSGANLKVKLHGSTLTSPTSVIDSDTNLEIDLEDSTLESKNAAALKSKNNLKVRMTNGKIRGKKAGIDTDSNLQLTMKKASEVTSSEGPAVKATSSFKLEAEGGKIDGGIVATSSVDITGSGLTITSKEKAIEASSSLKIDLSDSSITSLTGEAIEVDSSVDLTLANTKVQGASEAIVAKSNAKIKASKKTRIIALAGNGILTTSNSELTLNDASIEAGAKAFKGTVNDKVKLLAGSRLAGKKGAIEAEGNSEIDATGAVIDGGVGPGIVAGYNARISLKQGSLKGTPAIQLDRKPTSLELAGTAVTGEQKIAPR
jgi:hypothetical protein